jgi:hypothetical protein
MRVETYCKPLDVFINVQNDLIVFNNLQLLTIHSISNDNAQCEIVYLLSSQLID